VVIHDFDILCTPRGPDEADAKLIVNANAVLSPATAGQGFQAIAGRYPQIVQDLGPFELLELSPSDRLDVSKTLDPLASKKPFGIRASERKYRHEK
jgi:hypothetical protein